MFPTTLKSLPDRAGVHHRKNLSRFIYVKSIGWFVMVRGDTEYVAGIVCNNGLVGPFKNKPDAELFLGNVFYN